MKNDLEELNGLLFDQIRALREPTLKGETLKDECQRATTVVAVGQSIISNAKLVYNAYRQFEEGGKNGSLPPMLGITKEDAPE